MDVDEHVGVLKAHTGTLVFAVAVLKPVDDGVFDAIGDIARVFELVAERHGVDSESLVDGQQRGPVIFLCLLIKLIGVFGGEFIEWPENPQSRAATQICLIEHRQVS